MDGTAMIDIIAGVLTVMGFLDRLFTGLVIAAVVAVVLVAVGAAGIVRHRLRAGGEDEPGEDAPEPVQGWGADFLEVADAFEVTR